PGILDVRSARLRFCPGPVRGAAASSGSSRSRVNDVASVRAVAGGARGDKRGPSSAPARPPRPPPRGGRPPPSPSPPPPPAAHTLARAALGFPRGRAPRGGGGGGGGGAGRGTQRSAGPRRTFPSKTPVPAGFSPGGGAAPPASHPATPPIC